MEFLHKFRDNWEIHVPSLEAAPKSDSILRWIYFIVKPYQVTLGLFLVYRIFRYTALALMPLVVAFLVDAIQNGDFGRRILFYSVLATGYFGLVGLLLISVWIFKKEIVYTELASRALGLLGLKNLHHLPAYWHSKTPTGRKIEIIMDARKAIFELLRIFRWQVIPIFSSGLGVVISLVMLQCPLYYYLLFFLFPTTYLMASWRLNQPVAKLFNQYKESHSVIVSKLFEFSSSIITVKSSGVESFIENRALSLEHNSQVAKNRIYQVSFFRWFVINGTSSAFLGLLVFFSIRDAYLGIITTGACAGIILLYDRLWTTLEVIAITQDQINDYFSAMRRFIEFCKETSSLPKLDLGEDNIPSWGKLSLQNVGFSYQENIKNYVIKNISLEIGHGKVHALVGRSGAGKSTLIKLILGLYQAGTGLICLDGKPLSDYKLSAWLKTLAYVPQDIEIFDGSIKENILMGIDNVDQNKYESVLTQAVLKEFIETLPQKDQTMVGERGLRLSGGQKQRVGVARALLRDADLILLDEATSALDSITENQIQDSLINSLKGKTIVIIAHRLSTIRNADKIFVLENGELVESGSFSDLLMLDGVLSKMWGIQGMHSSLSAEKNFK